METGVIFISLVFVVTSALQVVLFFKLWIMTNNVAKITEKFNARNSVWDIRKAVLLENNELAIQILKENLVKDIEDYCKGNSGDDIKTLKKRYSKHFRELGATLPDVIEQLETATDVHNLFTVGK